MIPKIIHYCWFGGKEMPQLAKKCLKSWNKHCPEYKIMCWNEDNFDINSNKYTKEAYENKKFAFVTDFVRLYALYNYGGIYMDTDVEVLKSLNEFLSNKAFTGFESEVGAVTGIMASEKGSDTVNKLLSYYDNKSFVNSDGTFDMTPNTKIITDIFLENNLKLNNEYQVVGDFSIYPMEYFCPIEHSTMKKKITKNTYTIHWFSGSWLPFEKKMKYKINRIKLKIKNILIFFMGEKNTTSFIKFVKGEKNEK